MGEGGDEEGGIEEAGRLRCYAHRPKRPDQRPPAQERGKGDEQCQTGHRESKDALRMMVRGAHVTWKKRQGQVIVRRGRTGGPE
eukprot:scaffold211497_cov30-Tisochrysis_lutea.AAC.2